MKKSVLLLLTSFSILLSLNECKTYTGNLAQLHIREFNISQTGKLQMRLNSTKQNIINWSYNLYQKISDGKGQSYLNFHCPERYCHKKAEINISGLWVLELNIQEVEFMVATEILASLQVNNKIVFYQIIPVMSYTLEPVDFNVSEKTNYTFEVALVHARNQRKVGQQLFQEVWMKQIQKYTLQRIIQKTVDSTPQAIIPYDAESNVCQCNIDRLIKSESMSWSEKCRSYCDYVITATLSSVSCEKKTEILISNDKCLDCSSVPNTLIPLRSTKEACFCLKNYYWNASEQRCCPQLGCRKQDIKFNILKYGDITKMFPRTTYIFKNWTGWETTNGLEIGSGTTFNSKFQENIIVTQLDTYKNTEIWTKFRFQQNGKYILSFGYAFRDGVEVQSCLFRVILSSLRIWQASVDDLSFARKYIDLYCKQTVKGVEAYLSFVGAGKSDGSGAVITDIRLIRE